METGASRIALDSGCRTPKYNIRLLLEFDGSGFAGWQFQPGIRTVQGELQSALAKILGRPVKINGCSRTDAGVSARNYVANFYWDSAIPLNRICRALNFHLPREILVKEVAEAPPEFHARYSARSKTYLYRILRDRSPLRMSRAWEYCFPLESDRMRRALELFAGRHDFCAFCHLRLADESASAFCTVTRASLVEHGDEILVTVKGDRFLYKMVRRIVGAVVAYGAGRIRLADIRAALAGRKHRPFQTAPAHGLILDSVEY